MVDTRGGCSDWCNIDATGPGLHCSTPPSFCPFPLMGPAFCHGSYNQCHVQFLGGISLWPFGISFMLRGWFTQNEKLLSLEKHYLIQNDIVELSLIVLWEVRRTVDRKPCAAGWNTHVALITTLVAWIRRIHPSTLFSLILKSAVFRSWLWKTPPRSVIKVRPVRLVERKAWSARSWIWFHHSLRLTRQGQFSSTDGRGTRANGRDIRANWHATRGNGRHIGSGGIEAYYGSSKVDSSSHAPPAPHIAARSSTRHHS